MQPRQASPMYIIVIGEIVEHAYLHSFDCQPTADKISALKGDIEDVKQVPDKT